MAGDTTILDNYANQASCDHGMWGRETYGGVVFKAAAKCLWLGIPFAVCHLPGEEELDFFCGIDRLTPRPRIFHYGESKSFEIGPWLTPWSERISIGNHFTAQQVANSIFPGDHIPPSLFTPHPRFKPDHSISHQEYLAAVATIASRCGERDGKTVYSRVIPGENPLLDIPEAARQLFNTFPDSFGFLYYTPMTGCWLGASPETLLDFDIDTRRVATMAFAGTRPASAGDTPWDDKNLRENQFVADYICDKFRQLGIEPEVSAPYTVRYGVIQHLRRDITAILPTHIDFPQLLDLLNPTPALCGTPLEEAVADITRYEQHTRGCYGGFVGIRQNYHTETPWEYPDEDIPYKYRGFKSYVNLRSARLSTAPDGRFEIIAGGGIIAPSDPATEWLETEAKASRLLSILSTPRF